VTIRWHSPPVRCPRSAASSGLTAATSSAAVGAIRAAVITAPGSSPERTPRSPTKPAAAACARAFCCRSQRSKSSLRGEDVFVPEWRSLTDREFLGNTGPGRSLHDHCHLYRLSRYAHPGSLSLAMAGVGVAQHAVDYCTAHVDRMGVGRTSAVEREAIRHDVAEATAEVDAALGC
jgi:hypothetical protein